MSVRRTGLDQRGDKYFIATTSSESGRLVVERLEETTSACDAAQSLPEGDCLRLAVSDLRTLVKTIRMSDTDTVNLRERLQFELIQSLLDDAEAFCFDYVATGVPERHLGLVWRKKHLEELTQQLGLTWPSNNGHISFQVRSIALGRGYLAVCNGHDDNLTVLVDLAGESASLCYLYNRHIVDIASIPLSRHDLTTASGRRRLGVDLRTLMNYRLSMLLDAGVSVPLSGLLLTGESVNEVLLAAVQESFPVEVSVPKPHEGFFGALDDDARRALPLCLTALGLTVN
jgi:hypothetical protein